MSIEVRMEGMRDIVDVDATLEKVASGFQFTEGPIWHPIEQHLTFSDIPGNEMFRLQADGTVVSFRKPSNMGNGNTYDGAGRMLTCQHASSSVTRTEIDGTVTTLATHFEGKELNSPNDIVVRNDGLIYFTDPTFGRMAYYGVERELEMGAQGVYCVTPDGETITRIADDFAQPNGLCFSLDHRTLYVNDTEHKHIRRFDVAADGTATGGDVWVEVTVGEGDGHPDGMKIDSLGNVYCTGPGGVHVISPDGETLGVIRMNEFTANFAWGGRDLTDLYFTSSTSLYRMKVKTPGLALF
ncbi:SMP-30/gluconolactonase/LRE family protein [Sulfitobacter albidus]|uniref:SMP-30/gluconolactonase/LRE family protein n=1 Tax=Sulfitobacter albidus TaxID=2829501 RepID=A0A975JH88_9RHOB|nr:SMP-30/gluconolactonase/LRE family protein [Sulfitobacter albidus]QUJ78235.1 SMP-30/gluconolactonase/LRE family protein [Sulfitobacter albidus]